MRPMESNQDRFGSGVMKLSIGSTDDIELQVTAQYNPSQLDLQRTVGWERGNNKRDNRPDHRRSKPADNDLEYKGGEGRSLTLELLFDGVETGTCVEPQIEVLDEMATLRHELDSKDPDPRPHQCVIVWGTGGIKPLVCVIESIGVKYSWFDRTGRPLRALVTLKVKEASVSTFDRPKAFGANRHGNVGGYTHGLPNGLPRYLAVRSKK
jgi:hypothetical protein